MTIKTAERFDIEERSASLLLPSACLLIPRFLAIHRFMLCPLPRQDVICIPRRPAPRASPSFRKGQDERLRRPCETSPL